MSLVLGALNKSIKEDKSVWSKCKSKVQDRRGEYYFE